jgi:hypothetical protein
LPAASNLHIDVYLKDDWLAVEADMPEFGVGSRLERREAARLTWLSRRVPVGSILLGSAAATILASAVFTILAQSPSNVIP